MNTKRIFTLVKHQFEWEKNFFFFSVGLILLTKFFLLKFNVHSFIASMGIAASLIPAAYFFRPEFAGGDKGFSPKYLLTFPLTRKEYFFASVLITLMMALPLILWVLCFHSYIAHITVFKTGATSFSFILGMFIFISSAVLSQLFSKSRSLQQKRSFAELVTSFFKYYSIFIFVLLGGMLISSFFGDSEFRLLNFIVDKLETPWTGPALVAASVYYYFKTQRESQNEKISVKKLWSPKRDILQTLGFAFASIVCATITLAMPPEIFKGNLQGAVYDRNYKKIEKLINAGADINAANEYGMTPMMAALENGDIKLVKFLETKGANYDGEIKKTKDLFDGFDARSLAVSSGNVELLKFIKDKVPSYNKSNPRKSFYPLHVAARFCHPKVVDYLIANDADIEARTDKGSTPVVIAARHNCFASVISLREAGARFDIQDTKGTLALSNLGPKASPELKVYIEKNLRAPASE